MSGAWVLGIDIGGTGSRAIAAAVTDEPGETTHPSSESHTLVGDAVQVTTTGSTTLDTAHKLIDRAQREFTDRDPEQLRGVGIGATGMATLVADPTQLLAEISAQVGVPVVIAADAITAHVGALGGAAGAVIAVGTGSIAFGTDFATTWHRVDGWGHVLGDRGSGSWIGMHALQRALATHDGVARGGGALLAAAVQRFGDPETWPGQIYTRPDRAGVLASFTPDVATLAAGGDDQARQLLAEAGTHAAQSLAAALVPSLPQRAAYAGGLFAAGEVFTEAFQAEFARLRPNATVTPAAANPLHGSVHLARMMLSKHQTLPQRAPYLWHNAPFATAWKTDDT
ncbi:BadF/BadG/BcrA/BcrD ATPase family protein [Microbacterium mitrae]|uniref:ATPase BadF/BadG/BcrA/BcrD type domain-containing protein n=1 Tax=Microbacterium mitrae TaxID=664640 RepID=A0A5C8HJZ6_9MICO|nr:BadF/BadG/BcrA/BcrD ATPase family protein [Microbacterium mitrae]TXK02498.1 hypothetical protein FVP60_12915 [Microbacterium mitrae]